MNIERDTKTTFTVSYEELRNALALLYPAEFLLNLLPAVASKGMELRVAGSTITISYNKKSQGPAEVEINRAQRGDHEYGP
jgi:hypothetical protein